MSTSVSVVRRLSWEVSGWKESRDLLAWVAATRQRSGQGYGSTRLFGSLGTLEWPQKESRYHQCRLSKPDATLTQFVVSTLDVPACGLRDLVQLKRLILGMYSNPDLFPRQ